MLLTGFLPFLGIIIGASLQYIFTRHIDNKRHLRDLRSKAYMDYLRCVCELAQFRPRENTNERKDLNARTGHAKARICLYGSNEVIAAFSSFENLGASMGTSEQRKIFTNMVAIMRTDSGSESGAEENDLKNVLLGMRD